MLSIKRAEHEDRQSIKKIIDGHYFYKVNLDAILENTMIAYENGNPLAVAGYDAFDQIGILRFVVVEELYQRGYMGDGIVKAVLNLADKRGIHTMLVGTKNHIGFFKKIGFIELDSNQKNSLEINRIIEKEFTPEDTILVATLPEFFLRACRSNK